MRPNPTRTGPSFSTDVATGWAAWPDAGASALPAPPPPKPGGAVQVDSPVRLRGRLVNRQ
jgi:hypothetical protein